MTYEEDILKAREEKDAFFKNSPHAPLNEADKVRFKGLNYFSVNKDLCFVVELKEYQEQRRVQIITSKGPLQDYIRFGYVEFMLPLVLKSLTVFKQPDSDYFFIPFKDKSTGKETYEAGRYIDIKHVKDTEYVLDFNTAYNPYCAYSDYWVCPLTPYENVLDVEISAGEKKYNLN